MVTNGFNILVYEVRYRGGLIMARKVNSSDCILLLRPNSSVCVRVGVFVCVLSVGLVDLRHFDVDGNKSSVSSFRMSFNFKLSPVIPLLFHLDSRLDRAYSMLINVPHIFRLL